MAKMQRRACGHIAMVLPCGAKAPRASGVTKGKRGEDDDDYVIPTSPWVPAVRGTARARVNGPHTGQKEVMGRLVGCSPHRGVKVFLFRLTPIFYMIQI
jgi:hypothetical protein